MSSDTWAHRLVRVAVRPLTRTRVSPNHLTTLRLATGLLAAAAFATGSDGWVAAGGGLFLISSLLDRADGELARLTGKTTRWGHQYDLWSDALTTVLVFVGIGIGLRTGPMGEWAIALGLVAGLAIAIMFVVAERIKNLQQTEAAIPSFRGLDPDDSLFLVPPLAWAGWLLPLLAVSAVVAPLCLLGFYLHLRAETARRAAG